MDVGRRSFLKALGVGAAVLALPDFLVDHPIPFSGRLTLWGDGVHDDAPALQALVDGREVYDWRSGESRRVDSGLLYLPVGTFFIRETVTLGDQELTVMGSHLRAAPELDGPVFHVEGDREVAIIGCRFEDGRGEPPPLVVVEEVDDE